MKEKSTNPFVNNPYAEVNEFMRKFYGVFDEYTNDIKLGYWFSSLSSKESIFDSDEDFDNPKFFIENDIKRKYLMRMLQDTQKLTDVIQLAFDECEIRMDKASKSKTEYHTLNFFKENK